MKSGQRSDETELGRQNSENIKQREGKTTISVNLEIYL